MLGFAAYRTVNFKGTVNKKCLMFKYKCLIINVDAKNINNNCNNL